MYDDGIANEFEYAHNKGLRRGFDLGWTYKGKFDRQIISELLIDLKKNKRKNIKEINILEKLLDKMKNHPQNKENITLNFW